MSDNMREEACMTSRHNMQTVPELRKSLARRIKALLPGAALSGPFPGGIGHELFVSYDTKYQLRVWTPPERNRYFVCERSIAFTEDERAFLDRVMRSTFDNMPAGIGSIDETMAKAIAGTVAEYAAPDCPETALGIISLYESWSGRRRNGLPHTTGIKMARNKNNRGNFFEIAKQGIFKGLGSSPDTILIIDADGGVHGPETIPATGGGTGRQEILCPDAHAGLAAWAGSRRKVAVRLTEDGTVLLFGRGSLLFFNQGTCWQILPHTLINAGSCAEGVEGLEPLTLKALYLTALDLSAGKTSSRVILIPGAHGKIAAKLRKAGWQYVTRTAARNVKLLSALVNSRKFHELPRTLRSEICSLGGTLFLDGEGTILGLNLFADKGFETKAAHNGSNRFFPGRGYMELLNNHHQCNLHLTIY